MSTPDPLRVAVLGAGPSGFYAAEALLKGRDAVSVDLIDRLPTPYGLVRYGVAPDHERIKSVTRMYDRVCADPRVRFLGNVEFGRDLSLDDLLAHYHSVVYAVGAPRDRDLGIPGEGLPGSLSATEFVAWYNSHPDQCDLDPCLDAPGVAVVGVGNVAVDVTRILAKDVGELRGTDAADHALARFERSRVEQIWVLGRRGPAQAKFTTKELRELGQLENADIVVDPAELELDPESARAAEADPMVRRNLEVLAEMAAKPLEGKPRRIHLRFLVSPVEVLGSDRVEGLRVVRNRLEWEGGTARAVPTGEYEELPVGLVLRSVGYRGTRLPGVPFDERSGVIPNRAGRVVGAGGVLPGQYVVGWIKRGPSGVIGTNKADALETVAALLEDSPRVVPAENARPEAVTALLEQRGVRVVTWAGWQTLDRLEQEAGAAQGRPRVKLARLEELLAAARE